jgi:hypothetical protein
MSDREPLVGDSSAGTDARVIAAAAVLHDLNLRAVGGFRDPEIRPVAAAMLAAADSTEENA